MQKKSSLPKGTTNYGLTTSWKRTRTLNISDQEKHSDLTKEAMSGIPTVKSLKFLEASYTLITEDTTWELPMQELTPYKWDATSFTGIPTIAKNPSLPTSQDHIWHIQWDA